MLDRIARQLLTAGPVSKKKGEIDPTLFVTLLMSEAFSERLLRVRKDIFICVLNNGLVEYLTAFAKAFAFAVPKRDGRPHLAFSDREFGDHFSTCSQEIGRRLAEPIVEYSRLGFVSGGPPSLADDFFQRFTFASLVFIVAHEIAHMELGHLDGKALVPKGVLENLGSQDNKELRFIKEFNMHMYDEIEADLLACMIVHRVAPPMGPISIGYVLDSAWFFFTALDFLIRGQRVLCPDGNLRLISPDHPSPAHRIAALLGSFERRIDRSIIDSIGRKQTLMEVSWDLARPGIEEAALQHGVHQVWLN